MDETLYPWGYNISLVTLSRLKELARFDLVEPETGQRVEAWLVSKNGNIGIGGAVRFVQPTGDTFAPDGMSFHQLQTFFDGRKFFCAFDLVARNGANVHRSPRWDEVPQQGSSNPDISNYGVHANVPGEPWHLQPIEIDGWQGWVNAGRKYPNHNFPIKQPDPAPAPLPANTDPPLASRTLRIASPTMKGGDVQWVQNTLRGQGLTLSTDGYYGLQTASRVKIMQGWNGLTQDGVVGPITWAVLLKY